MSQIRVNQISGDVENTPVHFPQGLSGDGRNMLFPPEILTFTPVPGAINISVGSNIVVTFDQPIQFSVGVGTIKIRKNSVSGTVHESYATGSSGNLTISNNQLTINPSTNLDPFSTYFLEIPNVGIANTMGVSYKGNSESPYKFSTANGTFGATGGSSTHTTGGYKYHVFLGTGPLTFDYHTKHAGNITLMLVGGGGGGAGQPTTYWAGGGGGGGGVVVQRNFKLPEGDYTIAIGGGGGGSGNSSPNYYGNSGSDTFLQYGPTHPQYSPNSDDRIVYRAYGGGGGIYSYPTVPTNFIHATKGSGGGINGYYALDKPTFNYGIKNADGYGGRNMPGQGNRGGGSQGQPFGPNSQNGPDRGRQTAGGGGGAAQPGLTWSPYPNPPNPSYPGSRSGYGGDGLQVPEFGWNNWGPHVPDPVSGTGSNWPVWKGYILYDSSGGSRTGIGPQGFYGGGGGGGSARQPNPSHPAHENYMTAGRGGRGGGGHGFRTYTPISGYGAPVFSPTHPQRPNISPIYPGPENYAADGAIYTGGGGGGTSGPAPSYRAGRGATGIAILRYPV
tara:strand:+ start:1326 stop:2999 length:1674 start_codon:yes stop_codon:yes gene_type:complete